MFISFEGIDGAGKTSCGKLLAERLRSMDYPVTLLAHNATRSDSTYVNMQLEHLRNIQLESLRLPFNEVCELYWILLRASYYAIIDNHVIAPALDSRKIVVADGWFYKFAARIASNGSLAADNVLTYFREIRTPDIIFFLDIEPDVAARRLGTFNAGELGPANIGTTSPVKAFVRYQSLVRRHLADLAMSRGWISLTSSDDSVEGIVETVLKRLESEDLHRYGCHEYS